MSTYDLIESIFKGISEQTTMGDISYLPSTVGAVRSSIFSIAKMQSDWDVEIIENDKEKKVCFGDCLSVTVPTRYWDEFSSTYGVSKSGKVSLKNLLKEAIDEEFQRLRDELKPALTKFYEYDDFTTLENQVDLWRSFFGIVRQEKIKTAVTVHNKEKDIQYLVSKLLKVYGDDRGNLELLISALEERKILSSFEIFNKFDYLYGTKLLAIYKRIPIIYEGTIDIDYQLSQSIAVDKKETELIDRLDELSNVVVVKNVIYPNGPVFNKGFYRSLKNLIKDVID